MGVETRGSGHAVARAAVLGAVAGVALLPAGAAQANVVGIGNAVFGNTCVNQGDARAAGATVGGAGLGSGNHVGLPLDLPRNHCGNSGIICTAIFMSSV
ncbi:chaplin family protein [Streptomyces sp. NPDC006638]|uniref:chaplin family protein n=1 Tax=unclassified Streptomyces TaxID=2593676 RepID=UPI0033A9432C